MAAKAFLLLVAYYPLVNWMIRKANLPLANLWEEIMLLVFLVFAVTTSWRKIGRLVTSPVVLTALLFLSVTLLSYAANTYYIGAYIQEARLAFEPFMAFVILWLLVDGDAGGLLRETLPHLVASATIVAFIGVYQYVRKVPIPAQWLDATETGVISSRAFSLFGSPNVLAGYLETIIPLGVYMAVVRTRWYERGIAVGCVLVMGSGFLLTLTRAAWLSAAGSFFVGLFILNPALAVVFAAAGAGILIAVPTFRLRMTNLLSSTYVDKSNNLGRLFRWRQAFVNLIDHPLLGSGLGTFGGSAAQKYGYFTGISMDSVWIRVLTETGMIGFALYVSWLSSAFACVATRFFRSKDKLWLFASVGLLALLVNLFTDNLLDSWAIALVMWSLFALGAVPEADE
ncbi:O-antigen ligase family protein [Candidatus Cryosericum terrychapinii]|uniref:O-antigen ligase family protein n=1 Tax=Candidatus Cryosericum terrychapinii TaxID=2290919 RepID=UPI0014037495|nr:O-antigen ligase family protein [Candidatus Cryosericum terrychapinii]